MTTSELITHHHLARKAIIYIRQSTPNQVISNQESLRLQYALKQRAQEHGWRPEDIEIIDNDLGISGAGIQCRQGFRELLSRVALGEIGIIFSCEVTRLCRNCSDWYPLLDVCGYKKCLIADNDGLYDPGTPNGRLLLGLKGQLSEMELHSIRSRMTAGLINKAQRGELALNLPVGLIRDTQGIVNKDPDQEIQDRLKMIFTSFLRLKSACKVVRYFNEHELDIPRKNPFGDTLWKRTSASAIISTLKNPAYAGAFVYGRSQSLPSHTASGKKAQKRLPMEKWKIIVKDKYPAYINWETFEKIQAMLKDNYSEYDRNKSRGIPRDGVALLHGIVYCGECGHKMVVQYKPSSLYICNHLRQQYQVPVCQNIPANHVDEKVVEAFFDALSPIELNVYEKAMKEQKQEMESTSRAHHQRLQRLQYKANLARRQYDQVDPDNRLVASELEKRWENALRDLKQAEKSFSNRNETITIPRLPTEIKDAFTAIGKKLPQIWNTPLISTSRKKELLRCLIDKVVIHRSYRDLLQSCIVWKGGATTTFDIPIPVGSFTELSCADEMEKMILKMASKDVSDKEIAKQLSEQGFRSPMRNYVLPTTVQNIRLKHRLLRNSSQSHPRRVPGHLTVSQIAERLDIPRHWIYDRINKGCIQIAKDHHIGSYLFPDNPNTIELFRKLRKGQINELNFLKDNIQ